MTILSDMTTAIHFLQNHTDVAKVTTAVTVGPDHTIAINLDAGDNPAGKQLLALALLQTLGTTYNGNVDMIRDATGTPGTQWTATFQYAGATITVGMLMTRRVRTGHLVTYPGAGQS